MSGLRGWRWKEADTGWHDQDWRSAVLAGEARGRQDQRVRQGGLSWELGEPTRALCWWPPGPACSLSRDRSRAWGSRSWGLTAEPLKARGDLPGGAGETWERLAPGRAECAYLFPCLCPLPRGES